MKKISFILLLLQFFAYVSFECVKGEPILPKNIVGAGQNILDTPATCHNLDSLNTRIVQCHGIERIDMRLAGLAFMITKPFRARAIANALALSDKEIKVNGALPRQKARFSLIKGMNIPNTTTNAHNKISIYLNGLNFLKTASLTDTAILRIKGKLYLQLATTYKTLRRMDSVSYYVYQALPIIEECGTPKMSFLLYDILGDMYSLSDDSKQATLNFIRAYKIANTSKLDFAYKHLYPQLCGVYNSRNMADSAKFYAYEGLKFARKNQDSRLISTMYSELSEIYFNKKDGINALSAADSAVSYANEPTVLCFDLSLKAQALLLLKNYSETRAVCAQILPVARSINFIELIEFADNTLSKVAVAENNYKEAYIYLKEASLMHDSSLNMLSISKVKELEASYQSEKKDLSIKKLENEKLASEKRNWGYLLASLVFLIVAMCIVAYLLHKQQKRLLEKKSLQKELEVEHDRIKQLLELQELKIIEAKTIATNQHRKELSYMLHDDIAGSLSGIMHYIDYISQILKSAPEEAAETLKKIRMRIDLLYLQTRNMSHNLYSITSDVGSYSFALEFEKFVHYLYSNSPIQLHFTIHNPEQLDTLSLQKRIVLYRVLQESTVNIFKYANATRVFIDLYSDGEFAHLKIKDNGSGANSTLPDKGIGQHNLSEQLSALKGHFDIYPEVGEGYTVEAGLPV